MNNRAEYSEEIVDTTGLMSGIEQDEQDEPETDTRPFDPQKVSLHTKPMTASDCLKRIQQNTLQLSPDFQRNEVWDQVRKSRLMESLMLKIPLPMFYVAADELENYQVVDGLQRLSTLRDFTSEDPGQGFRLKGLEFWQEYNDKKFVDLPPHLQNRITEATFTFTIINPQTPEHLKRDVFKRINTGGLPLTYQEIRHALYTGQATELLNELVRIPIFTEATAGSAKDGRMAGRELILRFISFLLREPKDYNGYTMDEWLSHTMQIINLFPLHHPYRVEESQQLAEILYEDQKANSLLPTIKYCHCDEIKRKFSLAMERAKELFGKYAFRKSLPDSKTRSPINKGLFEVWSVLLCTLNAPDCQNLIKSKEILFQQLQCLYEDDSFYRAISRDNHKYSSVIYRYQKLRILVRDLVESQKSL